MRILTTTITILAIFYFLATGSSASSVRSARRTNGWKISKPAKGQDSVSIAFLVKQKNQEMIDKMFWDRSNPRSENFGRWLPKADIGAIVKNSEGTQAVETFLLKNGVDSNTISMSAHGEYITAKMKISTAERLLSCKFHEYVHKDSDREILKTELFIIPEELEAHVSHISHISHFPHVRQRRRPIVLPSNLLHDEFKDESVTPKLIKDFYNVDDVVVQSKNVTQSVFESLGQDYSPEDLYQFQEKFKLVKEDMWKIIGPNDPNKCKEDEASCGEANLDVQYIQAVAQKAKTVYWSMPPEGEIFLDWIMQVSKEEHPPLVHSVSYGEYEESSSLEVKQAFNMELQKLGLRGVSVLVSSGDDGVANFLSRQDETKCGYNPSFPASSPFVTAVGATQGPEAGSKEIACSSVTGGQITTGGGFSDIFRTPEYQKEAVTNFFKSVRNNPPEPGYNTRGRGIPDVSIMGRNYKIVDGGEWIQVSGTSASAPVFTGMITLINDLRIQNGKPTLGFLNQILYSLPSSVWNDITEGSNHCAAFNGYSSHPVCCDEGFESGLGWDPVTGLGTPKFDQLKKHLLEI